MSSLQNAIEIAGACEERIQRNDNVYLPVFSQSRGYQYIRKSDVYLPALLLILALVLLLIGTVRSVVHDDGQVIHKKKDEEKQDEDSPASPHRSDESLSVTSEEERVRSIVHSMFQRKKLWDVGDATNA